MYCMLLGPVTIFKNATEGDTELLTTQIFFTVVQRSRTITADVGLEPIVPILKSLLCY